MTDAGALVPIEPHVRDEDPLDDTVVVIRAGPLTVEKLVEHATRQQGRYSFRGRPMASISVDVASSGWTIEAILRDRLWSRSTYATCAVGALLGGGYELVPTFDAPHYDVLLPAASAEVAGSLLSLFGDPRSNPYKRRRR